MQVNELPTINLHYFYMLLLDVLIIIILEIGYLLSRTDNKVKILTSENKPHGKYNSQVNVNE